MTTYANLAVDAFIFTDRDMTSGGMTVGDGHVTLLTQGSTLLLHRALFSDGQEAASLEKLVEDLFPGLDGTEVEKTAQHVFTVIPHLDGGEEKPPLGTIEETTLSEASTIRVGGHPTTYCPPGKLLKRTVGQRTAYFSIGSQSLAGAVRPNPSLASVAASGKGVEVRTPEPADPAVEYLYPDGGGPRPTPHPLPAPKPHPGPRCGVCGVCGTCALCAEINYAAAAASAAAVTALGLVAEELQTDRARTLESDRLAVKPSNIDKAVQPLLKLADELTEDP